MQSLEESEGDDLYDHEQQSIAFKLRNRLANRNSILSGVVGGETSSLAECPTVEVTIKRGSQLENPAALH